MRSPTVDARGAPRRSRLPVIPHPDETMAGNRTTLVDLLEAFAVTGTPHVLIGGLVAGLYGKPRATIDVDMLVPRRSAKKLLAELEQRGYRADASDDMVRLRRAKGRAVADILWRDAHPLLKAAAEHTTHATVLGQEVTMVTRGAFVALKFHAAISPQRSPGDRLQDVADIAHTIAKGLPDTEEALAIRVAEKAYEGGGRELARLLEDLRKNRPVRV